MSDTLLRPIAGLGGESVMVWRDGRSAIVVEIAADDETAEAHLSPAGVAELIAMLQAQMKVPV